MYTELASGSTDEHVRRNTSRSFATADRLPYSARPRSNFHHPESPPIFHGITVVAITGFDASLSYSSNFENACIRSIETYILSHISVRSCAIAPGHTNSAPNSVATSGTELMEIRPVVCATS